MRGVNVAKLVESSAVNTLKVLHNLVKHSSHVRQALLLCDHKKVSTSKAPGNKNKKKGTGTEDTTNNNPAIGKGRKSGKNGSDISPIREQNHQPITNCPQQQLAAHK